MLHPTMIIVLRHKNHLSGNGGHHIQQCPEEGQEICQGLGKHIGGWGGSTNWTPKFIFHQYWNISSIFHQYVIMFHHVSSCFIMFHHKFNFGGSSSSKALPGDPQWMFFFHDSIHLHDHFMVTSFRTWQTWQWTAPPLIDDAYRRL